MAEVMIKRTAKEKLNEKTKSIILALQSAIDQADYDKYESATITITIDVANGGIYKSSIGYWHTLWRGKKY